MKAESHERRQKRTLEAFHNSEHNKDFETEQSVSRRAQQRRHCRIRQARQIFLSPSVERNNTRKEAEAGTSAISDPEGPTALQRRKGPQQGALWGNKLSGSELPVEF